MTNQPEDKNRKESSLEADSETRHTTDPQEDMQGIISSLVQKVKETVEKNDAQSKEEADRKKDKNT